MRIQRRSETVGDIPAEEVGKACSVAEINSEAVDAIYRMTTLTRIKERIVVPPMLREQAIKAGMDPEEHKQEMGFGKRTPPKRRW